MTDPQFPWSPGDQLDAVDLNAAFIQQQNLYNSLANAVNIVQTSNAVGGPVGITYNWAGGAVVTNGTYVIELSCPFAFTINSLSFVVGSSGGFFTMTIVNAGVNITGLTNITCSSSILNQVFATGNNVVAVGNRLSIIVSGVNGSPTDSAIQITGIKSGFATATLPISSTTQLGAVITGSGLNVTASGVLSNNISSANSLGTVQTGVGLTNINGLIGVAYGTTANTAVVGNDSRLNAIISSVSPIFSGVPQTPTPLVGSGQPFQIANVQYIQNQNYITNTTAATSTTFGLVKPDGTTITNNVGVLNVTYGTTAGTAAQGNDSRFNSIASTNSPIFTGVPQVPTAALASNSFQIASTQYVDRSINLNNLESLGVAPINNPTFIGSAFAPTAAQGDNTTTLATTAFVTRAIGSSTTGVSQVLGNVGAITLSQLTAGGVAPIASPVFTGIVMIPTGAIISGYAPLASPIFAGNPQVPTAPVNTSTFQIASTQFVQNQITASVAGVSSIGGQTGAVTIQTLINLGLATSVGNNVFGGVNNFTNSNTFSGIATFTGIPVLPAGILNYAPLASPIFTGNPTAPTPTAGDNDTSIATTAFVTNAVTASTTGVSSILTRTGAVTLAQLVAGGVAQTTGINTFTGVQTFSSLPVIPSGLSLANPILTGTPVITGYLTSATATSTYAPLANATLTGSVNLTGASVTAATASLGTNTTQLATTAFVQAALNNAVIGTIMSGTGTSGVFHADPSANMSIDSVYPFPSTVAPNPILTSIWPYVAPRNVIITSVVISTPQLTAGNGYTLNFFNAGGNIAGLTGLVLTSTTGQATYTPSSPIVLNSGTGISFQITVVTGTPSSNTTVFVQYQGTYN